MAGALSLSILTGCGITPKKTIACEATSPENQAGSKAWFVLDGYKVKQLGGVNIDTKSINYYATSEALNPKAGWDPITIGSEKISWNMPEPSEYLNASREWSRDLTKMTTKYSSPKNEPVPPDLVFECKETKEEAGEIVAQIKRDEEAQKEEVARINAEKIREQQIADGSYQPSEFEVGRTCKELAKENSLTKDVDWGFLGGANSKWFPAQKTIILEGKTKNAFGVAIPFSIECRWEKGGIVRVVEVR